MIKREYINHSYRYLLIAIFAIAFSSCEKEENPIVLPAKSDSSYLLSAAMGENYATQVFVNIVTGQKWMTDNLCWDLQLESSAEGSLITMNGGKKVLIANTGSKYITNYLGTLQKFRWDNSSGLKDSIVLGQWCEGSNRQSRDSVYIIDRGEGSRRPDERYYQFQIKEAEDNSYTIKVANIDGSDVHDVIIPKDHSKLHIYFSFEHGGQLQNFEPNKNEWHFCFLPYRWIYYEFTPPLLYRVCGIHINTSRIEVAVDSTLSYSAISKQSVMHLPYSSVRDVMGYDWKVPDFTSPTGVKYNCRSYVNYIIKEKGGYNSLFKLHFIGFYDQHGTKGTPQFEVETLH